MQLIHVYFTWHGSDRTVIRDPYGRVKMALHLRTSRFGIYFRLFFN